MCPMGLICEKKLKMTFFTIHFMQNYGKKNENLAYFLAGKIKNYKNSYMFEVFVLLIFLFAQCVRFWLQC